MNATLRARYDRLTTDWQPLSALKIEKTDGDYGYAELVSKGYAEEKRETLKRGGIVAGEKIWYRSKLPTYRQYDNNADQWQEWKRQAHALGLSETRRHASVSVNNRHRCHDCFCCACAEYVREAAI